MEPDLFYKAQNGDTEIMETLIVENEGLIRYVINKFYSGVKEIEFEDLMQEGRLGLYQAIKDFDPSLGYKFSTYAFHKIRGNISNLIRITRFQNSIPNDVRNNMKKIIIERNLFLEKNEREPNIYELSQLTGISVENIEYTFNLMNGTISMYGTNSDNEEINLIDYYASEDDNVEKNIKQKDLETTIFGVLETLLPREERLVRIRFGFDDGREHTLEEVGRRLGISGSRARQIESKALRKLKHPSRLKILKNYITD